MTRSQRISDWDPEDVAAWDVGNRAIARRNLIWSIATAHVAFSIWYLWSVMVLFMPVSTYGFSTGDKLLIGATASLIGAVARIPYAMAGARFGGRNWAMFSSGILLIPTAGTIVLLNHPGLPLWPYLVCAALTGLGGANYSASLSTAEAFFPQRLKGFALGLTGGIANLGSAVIQAVGLFVLATVGHEAPYWVCAVYLVLLAVVGVGAAVFMDNLHYRIDMSHLKEVLKVPDAWGSLSSTCVAPVRFSVSRSPSARCCNTTFRRWAKPRAGIAARRRGCLHRTAAGIGGAGGRRQAERPLRRWARQCCSVDLHDRGRRVSGRRQHPRRPRPRRETGDAVHRGGLHRRLHRPVHMFRRG